MLKLNVAMSEEYFDDENQEFVPGTLFVLELEHSLATLSKWESKFEKPFLSDTEKTADEVQAYIECMITSSEYPVDILDRLSAENWREINQYIEAKMSATWFSETVKSTPSREKITSEIIYYWLVSYQIPWEAEHWHLNRLFTLIKVFNEKNQDPKKNKGNTAEAAAQRQRLNEQRRAQMGTSG